MLNSAFKSDEIERENGNPDHQHEEDEQPSAIARHEQAQQQETSQDNNNQSLNNGQVYNSPNHNQIELKVTHSGGDEGQKRGSSQDRKHPFPVRVTPAPAIPMSKPVRLPTITASITKMSTNSLTQLVNADTNSNGGVSVIMTNNHLPSNQLSRFTIYWERLTSEVQPKWYSLDKRPIKLLQNLRGSISSGQLTALMGPSGCGKTTLLNLIAGRKNKRAVTCGSISVTGSIGDGMSRAASESTISGNSIGKMSSMAGKIIGKSKDKTQIKVALVPQQDNLLAKFSVKETLLFASQIRNVDFTAIEHLAIVDKVIKQLGLEICENNNVEKCSGGQQKRISIGQELIARPNVLLLDEPTSGLDSSTCFSLLSLLRRLAHDSIEMGEPLAVLASIHQPSARCLALFDDVYFMAYGGRSIYAGSPDLLPQAIQSVGLTVPQWHNPADYMIEIASGDYGTDVIKSLYEMQQALGNSPTDTLGSKGSEMKSVSLLHEPNHKKQSHPFWYHTGIIFLRSWTGSLRDPILTVLRLIAHLMVPMFMGVLFGTKIGKVSGCPGGSLSQMTLPEVLNFTASIPDLVQDYDRLYENHGFLFLSQLILLFMSLGITVLTFPLEAKTFRKEYHNGWYSSLSYFLGRTGVEIIFQCVFISIYVTAAFFFTGQAFSFHRLSGVVIIIVLTNLIGQTIALICGTVFMDQIVVANFVGPTITLPFAIFNTFFVKLSAMGWMMRTVTYCSFFHYALEGLISIVYGFGRCSCPEQDNYTGNETEIEGSGGGFDDVAPTSQPPWTQEFGRLLNTYIDLNSGDLYNRPNGSLDGSSSDMSAIANTNMTAIVKNIEDSALHWNAESCSSIPHQEFGVTDNTFYYSTIILIIYLILARVFAYVTLLVKVNHF